MPWAEPVHPDDGTASGALAERDLAEAGAGERREQRLAVRPLVVPAEDDLPHEVRVRELEALLAAQGARQAADATLAADPAHLDRLALVGHGLRLPSVRRGRRRPRAGRR